MTADCRLYLITPPRLDDLAAFGRLLAQTLDAGDVAAPGQELAQPAQEDHHRQRHQDGMGADIGDDEADDRPGQHADGDGGEAAENQRAEAGVLAAELQQDPGQRQPGHVGGVGDGEVEAAGDDRRQHGQRSNRRHAGGGEPLARRGRQPGQPAQVQRRQEPLVIAREHLEQA